MKRGLPTLTLLVLLSSAPATEDHLILVPTPITVIGDETEHTVIEVPYVSGYSLDFLGYGSRIAAPYWVDVHSPTGRDDRINLNPLSRAGLTIGIEEEQGGSRHTVTLDFSAVNEADRRAEILELATTCIERFGNACSNQFEVDFQLKGVPENSPLHRDLAKIVASRSSPRSTEDDPE